MPTKSLKERQAEMRARMATRRPAFSAERIIAPALVEAPQATETVESIAIPNVEGNTVSRADLYALVWAEPIVKVAKRFGVSDVAVAKACRRHLIPMPRRAFWQRLRAGQRLGRVPLPESSEPHLTANHVQRREARGYECDAAHRRDRIRAPAREPDRRSP